MGYVTMYVVFSVLFFLGATAYWVVTRIFRDESLTYEATSETPEKV